MTFQPAARQVDGIPIWVGGVWPHRRPFRRAARYDGVFPLPLQLGHADLTPADYREIRAYIDDHRAPGGPFDVVHYSAGPAPDTQSLADFAAAGVTWWLQGDMFSLTTTRTRIQAGPPA